jgi:hypothetical protein
VVDALHQAVRDLGVDLVIPVSDDVGLPLSRARERFAGLCALALPDPEALAQVTDKAATTALARRLGVPVPETALVSTAAEARAAAPRLGWPLVLKPVASRIVRDETVERYEVSYVNDLAALDARMAPLEGHTSVLLSSTTPGRDTAWSCCATAASRSPSSSIAACTRCRSRAARARCARACPSTRAAGALPAAAARAALDGPGHGGVPGRTRGPGPHGDQRPRLGLAAAGGQERRGLPRQARAALPRARGLRTAGAVNGGAPRIGVRSRNIGLELVWIASVLRKDRRYPFLPAPSRAEGLRAALRLPHPADGFDVLDRDDPRPGLAELAGVAGRLTRKARHAT